MNDLTDRLNDPDAPDRAVLHALEALETAAEVLRQTARELKASDPDGADCKIRDKIKAVNDAFVYAMKTEEAARAAGSERYGRDGLTTLDLDAAREEIRLRLACLRSAGDGAEVPEEP